MKSIITFNDAQSPELSSPAPEKVLSGSPRFSVWNHFADPTGQFFAGVWASTRGRWRVRYTENEFCHLLSGRAVIMDEQGARYELKAGDSFVIPAGFAGTWEVIEDCRKLYAIFEPKASSSGT